MPVDSAVRPARDGCFVDVTVTPGSAEGDAGFPTAFDDWRGRVKARVIEPPEDGRANRELIERAAAFFEADVTIVSGDLEPRKRLWVGRSVGEVVQRLTDAGIDEGTDGP